MWAGPSAWAEERPQIPGQIVFVESQEGLRRLIQLDPTNGQLKGLTSLTGQDDFVTIRPDGKSLLFGSYHPQRHPEWCTSLMTISTRQDDRIIKRSSQPVCWINDREFVAVYGNGEIWRFVDRGMPVEMLAKGPGPAVDGVMISPEELLYSDAQEPSQLVLLNLATKQSKNLGLGFRPSYSRHLDAFVYWDGEHHRLGFIGSPHKRGDSQKLSALEPAQLVTFSPGGRQLAWVTSRGQASTIMIADCDCQVLARYSRPNPIKGLAWGNSPQT